MLIMEVRYACLLMLLPPSVAFALLLVHTHPHILCVRRQPNGIETDINSGTARAYQLVDQSS